MRTAPISQVEIEQELIRLMNKLESETEQFETVAMDMAKKEALYKSNWAKEYISAKGSIKEREAWADYKLDQQLFEYKCAEALVKAKREVLLSIRSSIDAIRTLNANVRTQV
jgi:spore coat polysaccharide biosynthesis protein SpsF (cytidylyltransferase family)